MSLADPFEVPSTESPPALRPAFPPREPAPVPVKDCPRAINYEPHPEHPWDKADKEYRCEGIPEVEDQPDCLIYMSPEQPKCGLPAPAKIHVQTKLTDAWVTVCLRHKANYDTESAKFRMRGREMRRRAS